MEANINYYAFLAITGTNWMKEFKKQRARMNQSDGWTILARREPLIKIVNTRPSKSSGKSPITKIYKKRGKVSGLQAAIHKTGMVYSGRVIFGTLWKQRQTATKCINPARLNEMEDTLKFYVHSSKPATVIQSLHSAGLTPIAIS